jgi:hypothetical protein
MILGVVRVDEPFTGVFEAQAPFSFVSAELPAVTVPTGFRTRLDMIPPPLRRRLSPDSPEMGPVMLYAYLRSEASDVSREEAMQMFQEALRTRRIGPLTRWFYRLSM